jgi:hypothetical protein
MQGTCYGCGAALQTEQEEAAGYVEPEKYALKRLHRQLDRLVCRHAHSLSCMEARDTLHFLSRIQGFMPLHVCMHGSRACGTPVTGSGKHAASLHSAAPRWE